MINKRCFIAIATIVLGGMSSIAEPIDPAQQQTLEKTAKIISFFSSPQGKKVWPGFKISSGPTIVHFNGPPFFAFDLKTSDSNWKPLVGLGRIALKSSIDEWNLSQASSINIDIENQLTYIYNFGETSTLDDEHLGTFVHERFHRFQFETFNDFPPQNSVFLDHLNPDQLALTLLENEVLLKSIDTPTLESLKDIVSVHRERTLHLQPSSQQWERWQQGMEGTAAYIERRTFTLLPILDPNTPLLQLSSGAKRLFNYRGLVDSSIKWRHYPVGNILGFLLDKLGPSQWKEQVALGLGPMDIAEKRINMSDAECKKRLLRIEKNFDFVSAKETANIEAKKYLADLKAVNDQYSQDTGTQFEFVVSPDVKCSGGGGSSQRTYFLPDGTDLSLGRSGSWRCQGKFVNASVILDSAPIVYPGTLARFKIEQDADLSIDNRKYSLAALVSGGNDISFQNLSVHGRTATIEISGPGIIKVGTGLKIIF